MLPFGQNLSVAYSNLLQIILTEIGCWVMKPENLKISNVQLYIILVYSMATLPYILEPKIMFPLSMMASWYVPFIALLPGLLYSYIYYLLIKHSPHPFPRMLEYYWGKPMGIFIALLYVLYFALYATTTLRTFIDFQLAAINPLQPFSILLGGIVIVALYGIKKGIVPTIRALESLFLVVLAFQIFILIGAFPNMYWSNFASLLPVKPINIIYNALHFSRYYAFGVVILLFAHGMPDPSKSLSIFNKALLTTCLLISLITAAVLGTLGEVAEDMPYSNFSMVRIINLGEFIHNLDALFVVVWLIAVFGCFFIFWAGSILTLQQSLRLNDYRPLGMASAFILAVTALSIADNSQEFLYLRLKVLVVINIVFLIVIPLLTLIVAAFRGKIKPQPQPVSSDPVN